MAKIQILRAVVNKRLSAAVEELFVCFETTIREYEEELSRQRKLLDVLEPKLILHRADPLKISDRGDSFPPEQLHSEQERSPSLDQEDPEPPQIKQQSQELWTNQEGEQLEGQEEGVNTKGSIFRITNVKSEFDPDQSLSSHLPLHPAPLPSISTEPDGGGCGAPEPTSDCQPPSSLNSSASHSEDSGDEWKQSDGPQSGLKRPKSNTSGKRKREACSKNRKSGQLTPLDCPDSDTLCLGVGHQCGGRQSRKANIPDLSQEQQSDVDRIPDDDQLSLSHDNQLSLSHDDQLSLSHDDQLSMSHDDQLSMSHDDQLSLSHDDQLSLSQDNQLSLSHDDQLSLSHDDQLSLSHDDQLSMSHDDQLMPDDEDVLDSESKDDDDFNVDEGILGMPDNGTSPGSDTSISALPVSAPSKWWSSPEDDKAPNAAETSHPETALEGSSEPTQEEHKLSSHLSTKNYCYICGKPQSKISRHLRIHKTDAEIVRAFSLPEHCKERKILLEKIRNKGNFQHNSAVLENGTGSLKVKRRTKSKNMTGNFIHCMYCQGMYIRKELWRHVRRCPCNPGNEDRVQEPRRTRVLGLAGALQSAHCQQSPGGVWKLLNMMKQDEIASVVRNDYSLIQFAESLHNRHRQDPKKDEYLRQKLREVGRLLVCLRKDFSVPNLEEAFRPNNFHRVVQAVRKISGFDQDEGSHQTPSLALKLGRTLRKICDIIHCRALMAEDEDLMKSTDAFKKLHASRWSEVMSQSSPSPLRDAQHNKPSTAPFTYAIQKPQRDLQEAACRPYGSLEGAPPGQNDGQPAEVTQNDSESDDGEAPEAMAAALNGTMPELIHSSDGLGSVSSTVDETGPPSKEKRAGKRRRPSRVVRRRVWSKMEVAAVMRHFRAHVTQARLATTEECQHCKQTEGPVLAHRTVQNIRDLVRNRGLAAKMPKT